MAIRVEGCTGGARLVLKSGRNDGVIVSEQEIVQSLPANAQLVCKEFLGISNYGKVPEEREVIVADGCVVCPRWNKNCIRHE